MPIGTPWVRQQNCGEFLQSEFLQGVSAGSRHAERRKEAVAARVEMIDIVYESDTPDFCSGFPPFPPFPPLVFLSPPKGALEPWGTASLA
jgi:hypothetical protein